MIKSIGFASAWILPVALANLLPLGWWNGLSNASQPPAPLKALFITGGDDHDYKTLTPLLTNGLGERVNVSFDVDFTLDRLTNGNFANAYDVVIYDLCFNNPHSAAVSNALTAIRNGKPAVMIDCAVSILNAGTTSPQEHDKLEAFQTVRMDTNSPILSGWPADWKTDGDPLYRWTDSAANSNPLLSAKSPVDGRVSVVCWTQTCGKGRIFATTFGHDMTTARDPAYLGLLARGLLWSCNKLEPDGTAADGYGKEYNAEK